MPLGAASASATDAAPAAGNVVTANIVTQGTSSPRATSPATGSTVLAPDQRSMNRWLNPRRSWPSASTSPATPEPAATSPTSPRSGSAPAAQGLATAADHARTAGVVPRASRAMTTTPRSTPSRRRRPLQVGPRAGPAEATKAVGAAQALGRSAAARSGTTSRASTNPTDCRESALAFLAEWTDRLHRLGCVSGVYSSAGSGIEMLDDARVERPGMFTLPDAIWIARWDRGPTPLRRYIRDDGWLPGRADEAVPRRARRDLGRGPHQHRPQLPRPRAGLHRLAREPLRRDPHELLALPGPRPRHARQAVRALQCLLEERNLYAGQVTGVYDDATVAAAAAWMAGAGFPAPTLVAPRHWVTLLSEGGKPVVKIGWAGPRRAPSAAQPGGLRREGQLTATGIFDAATDAALRAWQKLGLARSGVAGHSSWRTRWRGLR